MRQAVTQHFLSASGQVAAALPPVVVMVYLSRTAGLEQAGLFTIVVGVSSAAFSTAHWGLRTSVLLDRFETISRRTFRFARLLALIVAGLVVIGVSRFLDVDGQLVAGLVLYKVCDGFIDLEFAVTQVLVDTGTAIETFAVRHSVKLLLVVGGVVASALSHAIAVETAFLISGVVALAVAGYRSYSKSASANELPSNLATIWTVYANAAWFAIAAAACAVVASAPRFSLGWFYEGDMLGVIGVTLSVSTFFGMIFYTVWNRHVPNFSRGTSFSIAAARFLTETALIAVLTFVVSWYVLPQIVGRLFAYSQPDQLLATKLVLSASILFFTGMNSCNLYKVTRAPWIEAASYTISLVIVASIAAAVPEMREIYRLLALAGLVMLFFGLTAFRVPRMPRPAGEAK